MKPEYIGIGNFDTMNYVYAYCKCPLPTDCAIKWPLIKDGKPHSYTCICEDCGTEVGVYSKSFGPEVYKEKSEDVISREAVLNEIYNTDGISNIYFCLADKINALLPVKPTEKVVSSSEKPNKWIPISERLPKTYGTVCATIKWDLCDLSSIAFGCYTKDEGWQLVDTEGNRCYDFTVIAWMPLQPYKEGSDKE